MPYLSRIAFVLFAAFIAWVLFLADTAQPNIFMDWVKRIPYGDKVAHVVLFGTLSLLLNLALQFKHWRRVYWGSLIVFVFVTLEEISQYFIPSRNFDYGDFAANYLGLVLFFALSYLLDRRRKASP